MAGIIPVNNLVYYSVEFIYNLKITPAANFNAPKTGEVITRVHKSSTA